MCCIFGNHIYLGSLVVGLAWGIRRCVCSGCCFGGYGGLVMFLVRYVEFYLFLRFFVLVLVRVDSFWRAVGIVELQYHCRKWL